MSKNASQSPNHKLEQLIVQQNPDAFDGVSPDKRRKILNAVIQIKQTTHSGPIPDADTLRQYNDIIPDGANRIMIMAENQSEHRMSLEKKVVGSQQNQSMIGQVFALIIGCFAIGCSTYCITTGYEFGGGLLGVGGVTGLVVAFIKGKSHQARDLQSKR